MNGEKIDLAIVGGGIAGSSIAFFLRRLLGAEARIHVYERTQHIGGRLDVLEVGGVEVEAGGTIIHDTNRYMRRFLGELGLKPVETHQRKQGDARDGDERIGVWDGHDLIFRTHHSALRTRIAAILRYGVLSPLHLQRAVRICLDRWNTVYSHLDSGRGFESPTEMLRQLNLSHLLDQDGRSWLREAGVHGRFIDEYVSPVGRIMYGQDSSMHAFATSIALAGAGLAGNLFSVAGGNHGVCEGLLREGRAELHAGIEIVGLTSSPNTPGYGLKLQSGETRLHDRIVLATPEGPSSLQLSGFDLPASALRERPFQTTWATFVKGAVRASYFRLKERGELPGSVLTLENETIPFSSLGRVGASPEGRPVYKLFSRQQPSEVLLDEIFEERDDANQRCWRAYPILEPGDDLPPFRLRNGLYWINAMEFATSTMETEVVGARNVSNLIGAEINGAR